MSLPAEPLVNDSALALPELVLRVIPMPSDTYLGNQIAGAWMLAKIDSAGSVLPMRVAQGRVVLVAIDTLSFTHPVMAGDLVSFYARLVRIGRTSISVHVEARTQRRGSEGAAMKVTEATLSFVAIDEQGAPRPFANGQRNGQNDGQKDASIR